MKSFSNFLLKHMFNKEEDGYKLSGFWYSTFRPINNRYYITKKYYLLTFVIRFIPAIVLGLILIVHTVNIYTVAIILIIVISALIDYFVIYKYEEKFMWKNLYSKQYDNDSLNRDELLMSKVDRNPNSANVQKLSEEINKENKIN